MSQAGRPRKALAVQEHNRRVHRSNAEKQARSSGENNLKVPCTDVEPPSYLATKELRGEFDGIASMLHAVDEQLFTELDVDVLARYLIAKGHYVKYTAMLNRELKKSEDNRDISVCEKIQRMQNVAFNQAQNCASALGLTVSSRLKLDLKPVEQAPKENKFAKFGVPPGSTE